MNPLTGLLLSLDDEVRSKLFSLPKFMTLLSFLRRLTCSLKNENGFSSAT